MPICCECLGTVGYGEENFLSCASCGTSIHKKCLPFDPSDSVRLKPLWYCEDCKVCAVCCKTGSEVSC